MSDSGTADFETALRADDRWLRALARKLVRDADLASDLAQQTWLSVITSKREGAPHRGLLRAAFQHALANFRRGDERRRRREAAGGAAQPEPDVADLVARVETQRALSAALLALAEPYRETLMRRYVEGLAPKAIAARANISVDTVKTRLKRGLELLRAAIVAHTANDASKRERLGFGLCALARWTPLKALGWKGLAMATSAKVLSSAAAIVVVAAGAWFAMSDPRSELHRDVDPRDAEPAAATSSGADAVLADDAKRVAIAPTPVAASEPPISPLTNAMPTRRIEVHVFDVEFKPLANIDVRCAAYTDFKERTSVTGRTNLDGCVTLEAPTTDQVAVRCADKTWKECTDNSIQPGAFDARTDLILAPRIRVVGVVVDDRGKPIDDVSVTRLEDPRLSERLTTPLVGATIQGFGDRTRSDGSFHLDEAWIPGSRIFADKDGFDYASVVLPRECETPLRIVLKRRSVAVVRGHVVTGDGHAPQWASVAMGADGARCGFDGRFEIAIESREPDTLLRAMSPGHLPAEVERPASGWPEDVELRLGGEPLSISGTVVDALGQPMRDVMVMLMDPTKLDVNSFGQGACVEDFTSGDGMQLPTADDGRFELKGLSPRSYTLLAYDKRTLLSAQSQPMPAGTRDFALTLPTQELLATVGGKVVFVDGSPAAAVNVVARITAARRWIYSAPPGGVMTDEHGEFVMTDIAPNEVRLVVDGDRIVPLDVPFATARAANFVLIVERGLDFCVRSSDGTKDGIFRVVDANNQPQLMHSGKSGRRGAWPAYATNQGASEILTVTERATTLVWFTVNQDSQEVELRRVPLQLKPGEVTVITQ